MVFFSNVVIGVIAWASGCGFVGNAQGEPSSSECDLSECKMNTEPITMDTYQCPVCQRVFHSQSYLNSHMNLLH
ncbi:hypothetical protein TSMEX_008173, partial [Taenia solium]